MLKNIYKYISIITITIIVSIAFTGSHSVQSVDDLAYAVALGIDVGNTEKLKVTFQFTMPTASSEDGSGSSSPSVIDSVEANSIDSAINLMNAYVSKEINLSHCKIIVVSEELARSGIGTEIYSLMNKVQIRPDNNVIITKCKAKEYIEGVSPSLENLVAKFYELLPRSSEYTGYTINAELGEFFNQIVCKTCQPVAMLGNTLSSEDLEGSSSQPEESQDNNSSESSNDTSSKTLSAKNGIENIGIAVFKGDTLVGTLNADETLAHLLITNELKSCNISIPDPENSNKQIDLYLTSNYTTRIKVSINDENPNISINIATNAKISLIDSISQEMSEERLKQIEDASADYLKGLIYNYLNKTSKEFQSDIAGFGKYALLDFNTMTEFENYNWLDHYQNSNFEINTQVSIKSGFLLTGT